MATILRRKGQNGVTYAVQVYLTPDDRKSFGCGRVDKRDAEAVGRHIDHLVTAFQIGEAKSIPAGTAAWVASIAGTQLEKKLIEAGLVRRSEQRTATIGEWMERFIASRPDVKPGTREIYRQIERNLRDFFGKDRDLPSITPGDADEFRAFLVGKESLAENTVRRRIGLARQVWRAAMRQGIISSNPFDHLPAIVRGNQKKFHFVSREDYAALIEAAPDQDWRTIIALCRIGGLRCPSEVLALKWGDVDWDRQRLRVPSSKTEHHEHGAERIIPLFPALESVLREAFDAAPEGATHIVTRYRSSRQNLRTTFRRIITAAGLTAWPKSFVNMRASRATELVGEHPQHVATAWMGHSAAVASEHYLRVLPEHFDKALRCEFVADVGASASDSALLAHETDAKNRDIRLETGKCADVREIDLCLTGPQGFEP
ncbi:MAG TPA: site-specific integrase [Phycisphaerae bacterium]|nr:site-specific integrase [Phycisphaerae bacterium]HRW54031.1 site-specific integrase [Phycisphaerae bacterium]